jgi:hypothetical protein
VGAAPVHRVLIRAHERREAGRSGRPDVVQSDGASGGTRELVGQDNQQLLPPETMKSTWSHGVAWGRMGSHGGEAEEPAPVPVGAGRGRGWKHMDAHGWKAVVDRETETTQPLQPRAYTV